MEHERFGKYAVVRKIASGGMADVYLCRLQGEEGFEKKVAVKVVHPRLLGDSRFRDLFVREARLASSLSHPNLIHVFDFAKEGRSYYLAMEFIDGWSLAQAADQMRVRAVPLPPGIWRHWVTGVLGGVGYLHSRGVVHRDISPSNVLLSRAGSVKITDFGIARGATEPDRIGEGKLGYFSPERAAGGETGADSDLFAVAVIATELLLGRRLFGGAAPEEVLSRLRTFDPGALDLSSVPDDVAGVLRKGLSARNDDRYPDAERFEKAIVAAVPNAPERSELVSFWSVLFPAAGEEETMVDLSAPLRTAEMVREKREGYGTKGTRSRTMGVVSVALTVSLGAGLAWKLHQDRRPHESPGKGGAQVDNGAPAAGVPPAARPVPPASVPASPPASPVRTGEAAVSPAAPAVAPVAKKRTAIETEPPDASVTLDDGTVLGKTPLSLDASEFSGRKVVFRKEGYAPKSVPADALAQLAAFRTELEKQTGTVEAIQATPWAEIFDGEKSLGITPIFAERLTVGEHRLRFVNKELGAEQVRTVVVRPGINPKIIVDLGNKK